MFDLSWACGSWGGKEEVQKTERYTPGPGALVSRQKELEQQEPCENLRGAMISTGKRELPGQ